MLLNRSKHVSQWTHLALLTLALFTARDSWALSTDEAEAGFAKAQGEFARKSKDLQGAPLEKYEAVRNQIIGPAKAELDRAYEEKERQRAEAARAASKSKVEPSADRATNHGPDRVASAKPEKQPEQEAPPAPALDGAHVQSEISFTHEKYQDTEPVLSHEGTSEIQFK